MRTTTNVDRRTNFICLTVAIGGLLFGFDTAVISGAVGLIKSQYALDTVREGWFVSSGLVGCIAGVLVSGALSDRIGRKRTVVLSALSFLLSGIGCGLAGGFDMLVAARIVGGIGVGMASVISPMMIAEFAPAEKRGRMIAYYQLAITVGILLAYCSDALFAARVPEEAWRPMFLAMAAPSIVFLLLLARIPESPRWLVARGQNEKALGVLKGLRPEMAAEKEFSAIFDASVRDSGRVSLASVRVPLLIGILLAVFQQFSGINAIIYYGPSIFEAAGIGGNNALIFQVIIGAINMSFTFVAIKWSDKYGRKFLLKAGLAGIIFSLVCCGALFYSGHTQGIVLLLLLLLYIACFAFSLGPVTWIIINEIFPTRVRVQAVSICTMALWIAVWVVGQFFPWMLAKAGAAVTFWLFAAFSVANFLFSWRVVKETKGKTLEEMESVFISPH
ncbi:MAG: sugar porter family MFS transporter [Bacteroidetes bacterium]|nr:sugar porter family MFS transporter [Bacteroidota bacterium]